MSKSSHKVKPELKQTNSQDLDDLIGVEDEVSVAPYTPEHAGLGQLVYYHSNNPLEDGILTRAAVVTKVGQNGSVSLTVFDEGHEQYFSKIPFASARQAGYYTTQQ